MNTPKRSRATPADYRERVEYLRNWIVEANPAFQEAMVLIASRFRIGRRQAIRYWVKAQESLLGEQERYLRWAGYRPRGRHGRYASWTLR